MARGFVRDQDRVAEANLVAVVEDAVDFHCGVVTVGIGEVFRAAAFHNRYIGVHHHVLRAAEPYEFG